jgi:hypothetical protein
MKTFFAPASRNAVAAWRPRPLEPNEMCQAYLLFVVSELTSSYQRNLAVKAEHAVEISQFRHYDQSPENINTLHDN